MLEGLDIFIAVDNSIGFRGRVLVTAIAYGMDGVKREVDREQIFKHPVLLRVRLRLAIHRILARQRKMTKVKAWVSGPH